MAAKKSSRGRKYGKAASKRVESAMRRKKKGTLKSGRSGKTVKSRKQAIAIGLSEARRAGVKLPPPKAGTSSSAVRRKAAQDLARGRHPTTPSRKRAQATLKALRKEPRGTVSKSALARQARQAASRHTSGERSAAARKAAATRRKINENPMVE